MRLHIALNIYGVLHWRCVYLLVSPTCDVPLPVMDSFAFMATVNVELNYYFYFLIKSGSCFSSAMNISFK